MVNRAKLQAQILDRLGSGDEMVGFPGLNQYLNTDFATYTKLVAIIMTPCNRIKPQPNVLMFQDQVTQLAEKIETIFGGTRTSSGQFTCGPSRDAVLIANHTPRSDQFSQTWTSSGKELFQYDPVQSRRNGVRWAMARLWIEDGPLYTYQNWWIATVNQVVDAPVNPRPAKMEERQDRSTDDTPSPSCLASMMATGPVCISSMSKSGSIPA